jgi:hypothetical protein
MKMTLVVLGLLLVACSSHTPSSVDKIMQFQLFDFHPRPIGEVSSEAFSGLAFERITPEGDFVFWTHTDRGPNAENYPVDGKLHRPFVKPDFQPHLIQFKVNRAKTHAEYLNVIKLTLPDGKPLSGLPNHNPNEKGQGDEVPVGTDKSLLSFDVMGADPEALCIAKNAIWMAEEYGPSVLKFDLTGKLIARYVPKGHWRTDKRPSYVKEVLPAELLTRTMNRGFEGMACHGDTLYVAIQSPLPGHGTHILITEFDTKKESVRRTFFYPLDSMASDKIGDMTMRGDELLILEQNSKTGPESIHRIYAIKPSATENNQVAVKRLAMDLVKVGYDFADKVEGITMIDPDYIAVINDNDFGLTGAIKENKAVIDQERKSRMAIIRMW